MTTESIMTSYTDTEIINAALVVMERRALNSDYLTSPHDVTTFVKLKIGSSEREHFMVIFLNSQMQIIKDEVMFSGTLSQASVYPREVVKAALACNASAIILAHNHPSGNITPSDADKCLTRTLQNICNLVDVKILDHIIVGGAQSISFAEAGIL